MTSIAQEEERPATLGGIQVADTSLGMGFERDFFGRSSDEVVDRDTFPHFRQLDAVSMAPFFSRRFQQKAYGFNPENPQTFMSGLVFEGIKAQLKPKDQMNLRMYCLLGTHLDNKGIDGIIRLESKLALVDITASPYKQALHVEILLLRRDYFLEFIKGNHKPLSDFITRVVQKLTT